MVRARNEEVPRVQESYTHELLDVAEELGRIRDLARKQRITLVYGAKDEQHNQAVVLREVLLGKT
jgi:uncharacterized protein YeaO (DUF488 family)